MIDIKEIRKELEIKLQENSRPNIDSIFIEKNGEIEKLEYKVETLHELRSCAKILVAMAIGIAIDRKMQVNGEQISLDTKVYPVIKDKVNIKNDENISKIKNWTIKNLLTHTTGYESQMMSERYIEDIDKKELLDYALNYEMPYEVGARFAYNNAEPFILSVFFQEAFDINLKDFIDENIFQKIDIKNFRWENYGIYCPAATGLYLKCTDFHKLGQLLLNDGVYNNIQIVPKYWINEMCKIQLETPNAYKADRVFHKIGIGYYTFISRDGYIFRDGSNGQYIILNKDNNLLITIMSSEKDMKNVTEIFRKYIN